MLEAAGGRVDAAVELYFTHSSSVSFMSCIGYEVSVNLTDETKEAGDEWTWRR
jgi:hypothetical protein